MKDHLKHLLKLANKHWLMIEIRQKTKNQKQQINKKINCLAYRVFLILWISLFQVTSYLLHNAWQTFFFVNFQSNVKWCWCQINPQIDMDSWLIVHNFHAAQHQHKQTKRNEYIIQFRFNKNCVLWKTNEI